MIAKSDPAKLAKYGWFAARLRRLMKEQGLRNVDLAKRMKAAGAGVGKNDNTVPASISVWVRALGFPGSQYQTPLAKALGVTEEALYAKPDQALALVKPSKALVRQDLVPVNGHENMCSVTVKQGLAELRLHVVMPVAQLDKVVFGLRQLGILD